MKGGGVFTQQSVRLSNFQIKIRFAGTCSWKRGNWLRLCSIRISRDIFWLRISFHDLHHSHEKVCLLMTAVYVRPYVVPLYVQLRIYSIATCVGKSLVKRIETCFFAKRIFTTTAAAA